MSAEEVTGYNSATAPTLAQLQQAKANGVGSWGGYGGPGAFQDWTVGQLVQTRVTIGRIVLFAFPPSDPRAMAQLTRLVGAVLCLDTARGDTPDPMSTVNFQWLATARDEGARTGVYGQRDVVLFYRGHMDFAIVASPGSMSDPALEAALGVPVGYQYADDVMRVGKNVDVSSLPVTIWPAPPAPAPPLEEDP